LKRILLILDSRIFFISKLNYKGVQGVFNPLQNKANYSMLLKQPKWSEHQSSQDMPQLRPYRLETQNQATNLHCVYLSRFRKERNIKERNGKEV
jgi:hypothetical protein